MHIHCLADPQVGGQTTKHISVFLRQISLLLNQHYHLPQRLFSSVVEAGIYACRDVIGFVLCPRHRNWRVLVQDQLEGATEASFNRCAIDFAVALHRVAVASRE